MSLSPKASIITIPAYYNRRVELANPLNGSVAVSITTQTVGGQDVTVVAELSLMSARLLAAGLLEAAKAIDGKRGK